MISPNTRCPVCGGNAGGASPVFVEGAEPTNGDIAICAYCASVLVYDGEPLRLRQPMGDERAELYGDDQIALARQAVLDVGINRRRAAR